MDDLKDNILAGLGFLGIGGFLILYFGKLFGQQGKPLSMVFIEEYFGLNGIIAVNILVFASFLALLPYRLPSKEGRWKSKGLFVGFLIALFTEMFGIPFAIFIFSPFFSYPFLSPLSQRLLGDFGIIAGAWIILTGMLLVALGWKKIHKAEGLVTDGIYRYTHHPQYVGLSLIMIGWLIFWPTFLSLIIFIILEGAYYWLTLKEEKKLEEVFGSKFKEYKKRTPSFFPKLH